MRRTGPLSPEEYAAIKASVRLTPPDKLTSRLVATIEAQKGLELRLRDAMKEAARFGACIPDGYDNELAHDAISTVGYLAEEARLECSHWRCTPTFDPVAARGLDEVEVRRRWPRFEGVCEECGSMVISYASAEHFAAGDW